VPAARNPPKLQSGSGCRSENPEWSLSRVWRRHGRLDFALIEIREWTDRGLESGLLPTAKDGRPPMGGPVYSRRPAELFVPVLEPVTVGMRSPGSRDEQSASVQLLQTMAKHRSVDFVEDPTLNFYDQVGPNS
jgi:hypothetical protein